MVEGPSTPVTETYCSQLAEVVRRSLG
jgi:hypothetical protein